jgi:hypothetical protein
LLGCVVAASVFEKKSVRLQGDYDSSLGLIAVVGPSRWAAPAALVSLGGLALALGMGVYMSERNAAGVTLLPTIAVLHTGPLFGAIGQSLPSFVHPFAFSLFTAAAMGPTGSPAYRACAGWWAVNVAFEMGQHPQVSVVIARALYDADGDTWPMWLTRPLSNYLLRGTFDVGDLAAATGGALAAAGVLCLIHRLEVRRAADAGRLTSILDGGSQ